MDPFIALHTLSFAFNWYICGRRVYNLVQIGVRVSDFVRKDIFKIGIRKIVYFYP